MRGKEVPNPCTAIRLFSLCDAMKWNHLPVMGGLYDQDPQLLDQFMYIFMCRNKEQERKQKAEERKAKSGRVRPSSGMHY